MDEQELTARLDEALSHGERLHRELRLTRAEADWVGEHYPAVLTQMGDGWYHMELRGAYC